MNSLRVAIALSLLLIMSCVEASSYSSSRHIRKPGYSRAKASHAPAAAHGAPRNNGPVVMARPEPHVQTLPATMLTRAAVMPGAVPAVAEPKLSTSQENELRWRLYSYP
ncbi:hypothetical protein [Iodobacter fluviatilis]|uniref:Lipoprotein n=1 Tax=Iodobacter fluviatilis TaxID=537 RepID=A0A377Q4A2_9NEIS|nr:hypothetical protein [Iodobacter fluviatilis]TCU90392.1 hypothetical protein EV682_101425 [Iodobacter fluviatilis]STQ89419.1 Uncharacterised protein [Iodobacter fluviatilis]